MLKFSLFARNPIRTSWKIVKACLSQSYVNQFWIMNGRAAQRTTGFANWQIWAEAQRKVRERPKKLVQSVRRRVCAGQRRDSGAGRKNSSAEQLKRFFWTWFFGTTNHKFCSLHKSEKRRQRKKLSGEKNSVKMWGDVFFTPLFGFKQKTQATSVFDEFVFAGRGEPSPRLARAGSGWNIKVEKATSCTTSVLAMPLVCQKQRKVWTAVFARNKRSVAKRRVVRGWENASPTALSFKSEAFSHPLALGFFLPYGERMKRITAGTRNKK